MRSSLRSKRSRVAATQRCYTCGATAEAFGFQEKPDQIDAARGRFSDGCDLCEEWQCAAVSFALVYLADFLIPKLTDLRSASGSAIYPGAFVAECCRVVRIGWASAVR